MDELTDGLPAGGGTFAGLRSRSGFTLMELLAVLAVMGVILGLVAPRMVAISNEAKLKAAQIQINHLKAALRSYYTVYGRFPTTREGLDALVRPASPGQAIDWKGPFLEAEEVPKDPWGRDYVYHSPGRKNLSGYDLFFLPPPD